MSALIQYLAPPSLLRVIELSRLRRIEPVELRGSALDGPRSRHRRRIDRTHNPAPV